MSKLKIGTILIVGAIAGVTGTYYFSSQKVASAYEEASNFLPTEFDGVAIIAKKTDFGLFGGEGSTKYRINLNEFLGEDGGNSDKPVFLEALTTVNSSNPLKVTTNTSFVVSGEAGQEISNELLNLGIKFTNEGKPYSITNEQNQFILPVVINSENENITAQTTDISKGDVFNMSPIVFKYSLKNNHEAIDISLKNFEFSERRKNFTLSNVSIVSNDNINPESTSEADRYLNGTSKVTLGKLAFHERNDGIVFENASLGTNYQVENNLLNVETALQVGDVALPKDMKRKGYAQANDIHIKAVLDGIDYKTWNSVTERYTKSTITQDNYNFNRWLQNQVLNLSQTDIKELSLSGNLDQGNIEGKLSARLDDSVTSVKVKELDRVMQNSLILDFTGSLPVSLATEIFGKYDLRNLIQKNALTRKGERFESHIKYEDGMPQFISNKS
ncbi:DUF945 family protein [Photobacterium leiognathi]|uniref:YdgA family protein n=1 Tax=Photobacterium leiognathi TaxID=553611 RepID=UPI001EE01F73|nr:YdgA family protein [Photobacterium leiognathi]MCG3884469.1 DUF945 family protein [Photobacterium leiognathi]